MRSSERELDLAWLRKRRDCAVRPRNSPFRTEHSLHQLSEIAGLQTAAPRLVPNRRLQGRRHPLPRPRRNLTIVHL